MVPEHSAEPSASQRVRARGVETCQLHAADLGDPACTLLSAPRRAPLSPKQRDHTPRHQGLHRGPGTVPSDRGQPHSAASTFRDPLPPKPEVPALHLACPGPGRGHPVARLARPGALLVPLSLPGVPTRNKSPPSQGLRSRQCVSWVFKQRH